MIPSMLPCTENTIRCSLLFLLHYAQHVFIMSSVRTENLADFYLFEKQQRGENEVSLKQNILFMGCVLAIGVVLVVFGQIDSIE